MKKISKLLMFIITITFLACITVFMTSASTYSGKCGANVTWSLSTATGVLEISGSGEMNDYTYSNNAPWYKYSKYIKSVNIGSSVTSIGEDAFYKCTGLTSVTIGSSVTSIGSSAFEDCTDLTSVTIGNSVTSIGDYAFYRCTGLTRVTIGNSVTSIGGWAFSGCTGLTEITIPDSVTSIGWGAFEGTAWYNAQPDGDIYIGHIYYKYKGIMPANTGIVIKEGTKVIGDVAFSDCTGLTEITIPDSVTSIGKGAFDGCTGLTKINWNAESVSNFSSDSEVFYNAGKAGTGIEVIFGDNVKSIPAYTFYAKNRSRRPNIKSILIGNSVTSIDECALEGCTGLKSITIGNSVTSIDECAFEGCTGLTKINWNAESVSDFNCYSEVFDDAGKAGSGIDVVFGDNVKSIPAYAFQNCSGLKSVTIGNGVTSIGDYAFIDCSNVKSISIPDSVEKIGWQSDKPKFIRSRKKLNYPYYVENAVLKKSKTSFKVSNGGCDSWYNSITSYDPVTLVSTKGDIYALCGIYTDKVSLISQKSGKHISITEKGFLCGAGIIGDDNMLYLIWAKYASDETFDKSPKTKNVKVIKYSLSGTKKGEYGFPLKKTYSMYPYDAGNAALVYNKGILCVLWNTEWNGQYSNDGLHHQGMELALLNTKDMTCIKHSCNEGSHSFGVYAIKTDRGFGIAQLGDAFATRGLNFKEYDIIKKSYSDTVIPFSSPGQYGSNAKHLDGNNTYISDIGFAQSKTTFAFCAYGTDIYTSDVFYNSKLIEKAKYDVYVRILDKSLVLNNASDCAGSNRKNAANGKTADKNVIRITNLNGKYYASNVKIVTLTSGAYCVLWNQGSRRYYSDLDLYYAILDEKGNILKKATKVKGGYMSDYNMPPIVQKNKLIWAVSDNDKLSWMTLDLKASEIKSSDKKTTSIKLTWKNVTGAKYYKLEKSTDGKKWTTVTITGKTSYTVKSLKAGTKYQFKVTALDRQKKPLGKAPRVIKTATLTGAPSVTLKSSKSKTAIASWKKVTGASKYVVYKSTDGKKWTKVTTTTKTTYTLTKLTGGKKIYVKVTALNAYGKASAASTIKNVTIKK